MLSRNRQPKVFAWLAKLNSNRMLLPIRPSLTKIELSVTRSMNSWGILESPWLVSFKFFLTSFHTSTWLGRVGHQKRIRKLVRMLTFSAGIQVVVWEECYWRWRSLNESIHYIGSDNIDGTDSPSHSQQARSLSRFYYYCNDLMFKNHRTPVFNGKILLCSLLLWRDPVFRRRTLTSWAQSFLINICQIGCVSSKILYLWLKTSWTSWWLSLSVVTRKLEISYERH